MLSFLCVCPVYGTPPHLLEESIQCFLDQDYLCKSLVIYDDLGTLDLYMDQYPGVLLLSTTKRSPTLNLKYQCMANNTDSDAIAIWEVDDLYLPNHLEEHNRVLQDHDFSYPSEVYVTTPDGPILEKTCGNLFASCAIRTQALRDCGGFVTSPRADSDLQSIAKFKKLNYSGGKPTYVFRWGDTNSKHGQAYMKSPSDETWYTEYTPDYTDKIISIQPRYHEATQKTLSYLL